MFLKVALDVLEHPSVGQWVFSAGCRVEYLYCGGRGLRGRGQHGIDDDVHGHQVHGRTHGGWEVRDNPPPVGHDQRIGYFESVDPAWMRVLERTFGDAGPHNGQRHLAAVLDEQLFAHGLGKSVHVIPAMLPRSPHSLLD